MRNLCGAEVTLCAVPSEGGLQNLSLMSASQADVGMAQLDTIDSMKDGDDSVRRLARRCCRCIRTCCTS